MWKTAICIELLNIPSEIVAISCMYIYSDAYMDNCTGVYNMYILQIIWSSNFLVWQCMAEAWYNTYNTYLHDYVYLFNYKYNKFSQLVIRW